jgi:hypothetical protein
MSSLGSVVVVLIAVALLVVAALLLRSRSVMPWPAIIVAMVTSGICFTVGGDASKDTSEPSVATVVAAVVGVVSVGAAITAMVPRSHKAPPPRLPLLLSGAAIVVGAVGLLVNELVS